MRLRVRPAAARPLTRIDDMIIARERRQNERLRKLLEEALGSPR